WKRRARKAVSKLFCRNATRPFSPSRSGRERKNKTGAMECWSGGAMGHFFSPACHYSNTPVMLLVLPFGDRPGQLQPLVFVLFVFRAVHAALGVIAFERVILPRHTVAKLLHQLLSVGTDDEIGKQQRGVRMGRI